MTEPEPEKAAPGWGRRTVTMSRLSLVALVLGGGAIIAIVALGIAAVAMGLLYNRELEAILAIGLILAAMAVTRLLLDLRRLLRVRARHRRLSAREADEDEEA